MDMSPLAGKPAEPWMLVNIPRLITAYYAERPDPAVHEQRVAFGTSGHRGSAFNKAFNEAHILAISQAICEYRKQQHIDGPLFLGMDTHALSEPAFASALEVLAAAGVEVMVDRDNGYTPTPVISHAILTYNRSRKTGLADGIVITPSHNPPEDGGFKYNPPHGGPADTDVTRWIEDRANALLADGLRGVSRIPYERARKASTTHRHDYIGAYVGDLGAVLDLEADPRRQAKHRRAPLGGCRGGLLGTGKGALWHRRDGHQRPGGSDLPLYDGRLGWEDPHGLLVPLCDGRPDCPQGSLRCGLRQRHRS